MEFKFNNNNKKDEIHNTNTTLTIDWRNSNDINIYIFELWYWLVSSNFADNLCDFEREKKKRISDCLICDMSLCEKKNNNKITNRMNKAKINYVCILWSCVHTHNMLSSESIGKRYGNKIYLIASIQMHNGCGVIFAKKSIQSHCIELATWEQTSSYYSVAADDYAHIEWVRVLFLSIVTISYVSFVQSDSKLWSTEKNRVFIAHKPESLRKWIASHEMENMHAYSQE